MTWICRITAPATAVAWLCLGAAPCVASDTDYSIIANIGVDSVSVFRGYRSRRLNPSVYGGVDIEYGDFFAGVFSSPVAFPDETKALVLGYGGVAHSALGLDFDIGARYFAFPSSSVLEIDLDGDGLIDHAGKKGVVESFVGVSKSIDRFKLSARAAHTPQSLGRTDDAVYATVSGSVELPEDFKLSGHFSVSRFVNETLNDEYEDYSIGLQKSLFGFDLDLRYSNTIGLSGPANSIVVISVIREFNLLSRDDRHERRYRKIRNNWVIDKTTFGLGR